MAKSLIKNVISRIKNQVKAVKHDAMLTDRLIYSFVLKNTKWLMKREDGKNTLMAHSGVIQSLDFVDLIEVDRIEACCKGISSDCKIKRTKEKMPFFMQGYMGPLIRSVTSIDGSEEMQITNPTTYLNMSKSRSFRYNKTKYFWYLNDYLYFPDLEWDAVRIEGIFEDDVSKFNCNTEDDCINAQDRTFNIPDYLLGELEGAVVKDMLVVLQIPSDTANDKQNILK